MSGIELIGAISAVLGIIDVAIKVSRTLKDSKSLPPSFREVGTTLSLVHETLRTAMARLAENRDGLEAGRRESIAASLEACRVKAERLKRILQRVEVAPEARILERYSKAIRALSKAGLVEELMKGIVQDTQLIAASHAIKAATEDQVSALSQAFEASSRAEPSVPAAMFVHDGVGSQFNNTGSGIQNNNTGTGRQFIGGTINMGVGRSVARTTL